jgi:hypothetical protein
MVSVYGWWQVIRLEKDSPLDRISAEEAHEIVAKDLAIYCDKNRGIRLLKKKRTYKIRDLSCSPRPWMIELYADGEKRTREILDLGWA